MSTALTLTSSSRDREIKSSTSPTTSKPNFFTRMPTVVTNYIFSFNYSGPLPICNKALHSQFTQLAESRLLPKFAPQLLGIEAKEVNLMTPADLRNRVNAAVLVQLKTMRTLFTRCELQAETGISDPGTLPLPLNPLLPLGHTIAYTSQWNKLLNLSAKQQEKYTIPGVTDGHLGLWPNILNLKLQKKEVEASQLSITSEQINQITASLENADPSSARNLFLDNIDRLHDSHTNHYLYKTDAYRILPKFLQNPDVVKHLLPKDFEYALLHILTNELTFDPNRIYLSRASYEDWDFSELLNSLFANLINTKANLDPFKIHLQQILRMKALEFRQQSVTVTDIEVLKRRLVAFGKRLRAFQEVIDARLPGFDFPVEFTRWVVNPEKWRSPQEKCVVQ